MAPVLRHVYTDRSAGDLAVSLGVEELSERRAAIHEAPWTWLRQDHGSRVVVVDEPGAHAGTTADAAVTDVIGAPIAVHTADCAPILIEADGAVGVVHAGWRGLIGGVIEATAAALVDLGHPPRSARLGPCIRHRCYEFGPDDLDLVAERYGPSVIATTAWDAPALDLAAGVEAACTDLGIGLIDGGTCTACSPNHWSHRTRGDRSRQALVAWLDDDPVTGRHRPGG